MKIQIIKADITKQAVDAIVNAANERMLGGGGVDGAIHRAARPRLYDECLKVPQVRPGVRCPVGEARITPGCDLPAKYVIHTVGPDCGRLRDEGEQDRLLASAYRASLELAQANGVKTIAFPSISTGIYGFPIERAAPIMAKTVGDFLAHAPEMEVTLCIYDPDPSVCQRLIAAYKDAVAAYESAPQG